MNIPESLTFDSSEEKPSDELYLVLKHVFYDRIKNGTKKTEYRDFTVYNRDKILDHPFKTVKFNRGYTNEHMVFEIDWIGVLDGDREIHAFDKSGNMNPEGADDDFQPDTISIHLGKRIK